MTLWTPPQLAAIDAAHEIDVAPDRADGTGGPHTTIWIVRVGDDLYVRSYRGIAGSWYQRAVRNRRGSIRAGGADHEVSFTPAVDPKLAEAIDDAYRDKYGRQSSYVAPMINAAARATTLRVEPA